jgi:CheY-like chemotaxis protein
LATTGFQYRILIVEDDASLREFGKLLLSAQGYEVLCAEDGFEGLAALKQSLPDIIISDLRMPNMNGFEFLSVVRRRFPSIPVIAISGEFSGLSVPESVLADAFFSKGQYQPPQLFEKIGNHCGRGRCLHRGRGFFCAPGSSGHCHCHCRCRNLQLIVR